MGAYGFRVVAKVKEIKNFCGIGHEVGDEVIFDEMEVKGKLCNGALSTIIPAVYAMMWGSEFPWDENKDVTTVPCADCKNPVVFELTRVRKNPWYTEKLKTTK